MLSQYQTCRKLFQGPQERMITPIKLVVESKKIKKQVRKDFQEYWISKIVLKRQKLKKCKT